MVTCRIEHMLVETFTNQSGGRYPPKTLNLLICGLNRHLADGKHDNKFTVLEKTDQRTYFELPWLNISSCLYQSTKVGFRVWVRDFGFSRSLLIVAYIVQLWSNWIKILVVWFSMNVISILYPNYRTLLRLISIPY